MCSCFHYSEYSNALFVKIFCHLLISHSKCMAFLICFVHVSFGLDIMMLSWFICGDVDMIVFQFHTVEVEKKVIRWFFSCDQFGIWSVAVDLSVILSFPFLIFDYFLWYLGDSVCQSSAISNIYHWFLRWMLSMNIITTPGIFVFNILLCY